MTETTTAPRRAANTQGSRSSREKTANTGRRPLTLVGVAERYGLLILVVVLVVVFSVLPQSGEAFRSPANLQAVIANQGVRLVVALALLLPMAAGYFDFSVGAVTAASSVVAAAALAHFDLPLGIAIASAIAFGTSVGTLIGILVAKLGMNSFIATLGVATLLGGIIFAYTGGLQITTGIPTALTDLGSQTLAGVPYIAIAASGIAVVIWYLMTQTPFGRRLFAIGSNPNAAELTGTRVARTRLLSFVASGTISGVAGVLLLARQGAATSDNGMTMLFPALTAVLLSTIVIDLGRPSVIGTVIGLLFVAFSVSGLTLLGSPAWVSQVFNGAALLVAVGFARVSVLWRRQG